MEINRKYHVKIVNTETGELVMDRRRPLFLHWPASRKELRLLPD